MYRLRGNYCIYKTLKCVIKGCCCCVKINDLFYWSVNGTDITIYIYSICVRTEMQYTTIKQYTFLYKKIAW